MPQGIPRGAMCVQRFDDSLNSAIHTTYRISLRSSSMPEPRDPLLKVLIVLVCSDKYCYCKSLWESSLAGVPAEEIKVLKIKGGWNACAGPKPYCISVMILPKVHLRNGCVTRPPGSLQGPDYILSRARRLHPLPLSL